VEKNRVGRSEIDFLFLLNFISNSSEYIANSNTIMRVFIELNNGFISYRTAHIKMCSIYLKLVRRVLQFLWSGIKSRVGRVCGNTTFFLGLMVDSPPSPFLFITGSCDTFRAVGAYRHLAAALEQTQNLHNTYIL
jgi:hypothetical protein